MSKENVENVERLLEKYNSGLATEEERAFVESWYLVYKESDKNFSEQQLLEDQQQSLNKLLKLIEGKKTIRLWPRLIAATACISIVIGVFFYVNNLNFNKSKVANYTTDIAPGSNTALLTLASGETITLNNGKNGIVINSQQLTYDDGSSVINKSGRLLPSKNPERMNTITTPRGGTYQVILPDGTRVWLNAASSLKFPSSFKDLNNRTVELMGEAYFDVAKIVLPSAKETVMNADGSAKQRKIGLPFIVKTAKQEVEVFGTQFNVNSYDDEPVTKTTLFEGSVKVSLNQATQSANNLESQDYVFLRPGQQAILQRDVLKVGKADTEADLAWKNGDLNLRSEDFKATMRKIARWYNVDIIYDPSAPTDLILGGWVSRSKNISAVLKVMELTGKVHFKIEERRITVTK